MATNAKSAILFNGNADTHTIGTHKIQTERSLLPPFVHASETMVAVRMARMEHEMQSERDHQAQHQDVDISRQLRMSTLAPPFCAYPSTPMFVHTSGVPASQQHIPTFHMPSVSISTVGIGIHAGQFYSSMSNATEAAIRALRDALDRSTLRISMQSQHGLQVHVKLGVPAEPQSPSTPMAVDMIKLMEVLPPSVTVAPISVVVGGLFVSGLPGQEIALCSVVACLTIQLGSEYPNLFSTQIQSNLQVPAEVQECPNNQQPSSLEKISESPMDMLAQISEEVRKKSIQRKDEATKMLVQMSMEVKEQPNHRKKEETIMPSQISEKIKGKSPHRTKDETTMLSQVRAKVDIKPLQAKHDEGAGIKPKPRKLPMNHVNHQNNESNSDKRDRTATIPDKVVTGLTAKNNQRHIVQHIYNDNSQEKLTPLDAPLNSGMTGKSSSISSFPIKLHEALIDIENDGNGHIISWQPHGRSFKIHKQPEFERQILPQYFVMKKKSSFLRQLNLYGFHRLSVGPDKGGYYHELFLRGMQFLSRRMIRQKVNGNGIRAAGNPSQEPNFYLMSTVPPIGGTLPAPPIVATTSSDEADDDSMEDGSAEGTSVDTAPRRPLSHVSFPVKLQRMLDSLEIDGNSEAISWMPHGRSFLVHQPDKFAQEIMPRFFRQTKLSSFRRQLYMYSFQRFTRGKDKGGYFHPNCLRGHPELCQSIARVKVNGRGCRKPAIPSCEPDLYRMPFMPPATEAFVDIAGLKSFQRQEPSSADGDDESTDSE